MFASGVKAVHSLAVHWLAILAKANQINGGLFKNQVSRSLKST